MKQYWPIMGAVGLAATVGLYAYVSRDPLYEEQETEEFTEEEQGYEAELPDEEIPAPYTPKVKKEKNQIKNKQNSPKYDKKEIIPRAQIYHPSSPKSSRLEDFEFRYRARKYFDEALEAKDYKIAETYIDDLPEDIKKDLLCQIVVSYSNYLTSVSKNCETQDHYSVLRKVLSMEAILDKYKEDISCEAMDIKTDDETGAGTMNLTTIKVNELQMKGEKVLQKVIANCHE